MRGACVAQAGPPSRPDSRTHPPMRRSMAMLRTLRPGPESKAVRGIVFVDGTLTVPVLDFPKMRRVVEVPEGQDVLDFLAGLEPAERAQREAALHAVEEEGMAAMQVMPGVEELAKHLDERAVPRALVTRNLKRAVDLFHATHFDLPPFEPVLTREFLPYKPHPAALLHIAEHWGITPQELVMVGDSAKDDVVSGNRAGAWTILLDTEGTHRERGQGLEGDLRPHFYAASMQEVQQILTTELQLPSPRVT
ncbi:hypothetical protein ACKKBF_B10965 [Auxenochlorella protothecoides x Auxenochlorella symbiontica]